MTTRSLEDLHTVAAAYHNLGSVCVDLGETGAAVDALQRARDLLHGLDLPSEITRNDWVLSRVLMSNGSFLNALPILRRVRADFLTRQMQMEAGLAALDLAETWIALNQIDEARAVAELALKEFQTANLNERAVTALAYLHQLLPRATKPAQAVRQVRTYLEQLRDEPTLLFRPGEE